MKKYEVLGKSACLGAGMILHLTEQQAAVRRDCLTQKNGNYIVNIPVYFKKEKLSVLLPEMFLKALCLC